MKRFIDKNYIGERMSGECDKCGEHALECKCELNSWKLARAKEINNNKFYQILKFIFHPCFVALASFYVFNFMEYIMICVICLSLKLYIDT